MQVQADFYSDVIDAFRRALVRLGYAAHKIEAPEDVMFVYLNSLRRRISMQKRRVLEAREFHCPPGQVEGYLALKSKLENGRDVAPHLSKFIRRADFNDMLLNDWGIHHLHIGPDLDGRGFVKRANELLFLRVTTGTCFCLAIGTHDDWTNVALVERLQANWPAELEPLRLPDISDVTRITPEDRAGFRRAGFTTPLDLGGAVYMPPGGGVVRSGLSLDVVQDAMRYTNLAIQAQTYVQTNIERYAVAAFLEQGCVLGDPVRARFEMSPRGRHAVRFTPSGARFEILASKAAH